MARADGTIRVNILGDARDLKAATKDSEKALGGIGKAAKIAGGAIVAGLAVDAIVEFADTALSEADRIHDAMDQIAGILGADVAEDLKNAASGLEDLGLSRQDVLELEGVFLRIGSAAHIGADDLAKFAPKVAETAGALALMGFGEGDPSQVINDIGKAAGGATKPLKNLGVDLSEAEVEARAMKDTGKENADALTDQELATARMNVILDKLAPKLAAGASGTADMRDRQAELQARWETLTGKIGEGIEGPLNDFLGWVLTGIDGLGRFGELVDVVAQNFRDALGPIARARDAIEDVLTVIDEALKGFGLINDAARNAPGGGRIVGSPSNVTVVVQGGSPEVVQQSVQRAVNNLNNSGPWQGEKP